MSADAQTLLVPPPKMEKASNAFSNQRCQALELRGIRDSAVRPLTFIVFLARAIFNGIGGLR